MFPYAFPNLIVALSILIMTFAETSTGEISENINMVRRIVFFIIFIFLAKLYYNNTPETIGAKAFIISFNLSTIPLIIANITVINDFLDGGKFGDSILMYLIPFIYTPITLIVSFVILFIFFKLVSKIDNKTE